MRNKKDFSGRNAFGNNFENREGFHEFSEREGRGPRSSSQDDSMMRSERNDYRATAGSTYGSRGTNYGSSYTPSDDYDYNRAGYRGDSSGFSGQNRGDYGSGYNQSWEQSSRGNNNARYDQDYSTRRALEDREIGINANSPSQWDSGSSRSSQSYGQHAGKGPKGYRRSDDRIKEDVCDALERHSEIDASEVEVDVAEGVVTLSGTVESRQIKRMAEDLIDGLTGVSEVKNDLRVMATPEGAQRARMSSSFDSTKADSDSTRLNKTPPRSASSTASTTGKSVQ